MTGTVFVRVCLVIILLLGNSRPMPARDWMQSSADRKSKAAIGDSLRVRSFAPSTSSIRKRTAPLALKLVVGSGEDLIEFVPPIVKEESLFEPHLDPAGQALIHDLEIIEDDTDGGLLEASTILKPIPSEAIPLDGAFRDDGKTKEEKKQPPAQSRSSFGWLAGSQNNLGMLELELEPLSRVTYDAFGTPRGDGVVAAQNLRIRADTPFGARWLNGPSDPDLPPYLYNVGVSVEATYFVNDRFAVEGMITPSFYSDFSNKGSEAFRLPWRAVTYTRHNEVWQWVLGVTDLSRQDIQLLPVTGFIYAPRSGDIRYDLVFPKPRMSWRVSERSEHRSGNWTVEKHEGWVYLAGEIGGGSWAISRSDRSYDVVTYRDYRLFAGWENKRKRGHASRIEVGWIFGRAVQYQSNNGDYNPGDTFMVRMSSDY